MHELAARGRASDRSRSIVRAGRTRRKLNPTQPRSAQAHPPDKLVRSQSWPNRFQRAARATTGLLLVDATSHDLLAVQ